MKKILLSLMIASSFSAQANIDVLNFGDLSKSEPKIILGLGSYHLNKEHHHALNEKNESLGLELWDLQAVYVLNNSWSKESLYLTYAPDYELNKYISLSAQAGIATGYKCKNEKFNNGVTYKPDNCSKSGVVPIGALTIDYSPLGNGLNLSLSFNYSFAMLSINYEL